MLRIIISGKTRYAEILHCLHTSSIVLSIDGLDFGTLRLKMKIKIFNNPVQDFFVLMACRYLVDICMIFFILSQSLANNYTNSSQSLLDTISQLHI